MGAAAKGDAKSITALAKGRAGAEVNAKDVNDRTALMEAAQSGNPAAVKALLDESADVGMADKWQQTALMEAAKLGNRESTRLLLDKIAGFDDGQFRGALINTKDENGRTALLVNKGANVYIPDKDGRTALMQAARRASGQSSGGWRGPFGYQRCKRGHRVIDGKISQEKHILDGEGI